MTKENEEWTIAIRKKGNKTGDNGVHRNRGAVQKTLCYAVLLKPSENQWANFDSRFDEVKF